MSLRQRSNGHVVKPNGSKTTIGAVSSGVEKTPPLERTDYSLWRLKVEHGRQTWHYITPQEAEQWPQSVPEKYHLGLETVPSPVP